MGIDKGFARPCSFEGGFNDRGRAIYFEVGCEASAFDLWESDASEADQWQAGGVFGAAHVPGEGAARRDLSADRPEVGTATACGKQQQQQHNARLHGRPWAPD